MLTRNVCYAQGVPNNHILIFYWLIISDEKWQAFAAFALIRIDSSGIELLRIVARGPEMIIDELGARFLTKDSGAIYGSEFAPGTKMKLG